MTTLAPKPGSRATRRFEATDPRADEGRRVVIVGPDGIVIARGIQGVFMRIALAPRAYEGVALRLLELDDAGFLYEIRLLHADADLGVGLAMCRDPSEAETAWRHWARFLSLPMLVERVEGVYEPYRSRPGAVVAGAPAARRRGAAVGSRRARFLTRRKLGRPELCAQVNAIHEFSGGLR